MTTVPSRRDDAVLAGAALSVPRLAGAIGLVGPLSAASLVTFFAAGGPFGALNDVGNAALGVLAGSLAVGCHRAGTSAGATVATTTAAVAGGALTVVGSALVMTETTGYYLAGLVSATGFGLIGTWLVDVNLRPTEDTRAWPPGLTTLGAVAGTVMTAGLLSIPGVVARTDDLETAPWWLVASGVAWLGTYALMPAWALRLRRVLRRG
ncbi:MAG TPA: hypothetical protein VFV40_00375 [Nocardioides sp.]|nr:hypothetical protein [Nocardioides sp.]